MAAIPFLVYAYEYGPDAGAAGVPGENGSCSQIGCHTGTAVNAGGGSVSVALPAGSDLYARDRAAPGRHY